MHIRLLGRFVVGRMVVYLYTRLGIYMVGRMVEHEVGWVVLVFLDARVVALVVGWKVEHEVSWVVGLYSWLALRLCLWLPGWLNIRLVNRR